MTGTVTIILVIYRSRGELDPLWACLQAQSLLDWRLVAIDNSPEDGGGAFLVDRRDARVSVLQSGGNVGFARAVNAGLRHAAAQGCERFLLLNPDTSFGPAFLGELLRAWDQTGAEVIAPRVMYQDDPDHAWYAGGWLDYGWTFANRHEEYRPGGPRHRIVEFASGCCLGLSRGVLDRVGLLDESFFVYWEDTDFCLRLKAAGVPIHYVEHPFLLHRVGASSGGDRTPAAEALYYGNYAVLLRKHFPRKAALKMLVRSFLKERSRPGRHRGRGVQVGRALLTGYLRPRRSVPRLDDARLDEGGPPGTNA